MQEQTHTPAYSGDGAECPNCGWWTQKTERTGELCPECANGADRAHTSSGWQNKLLMSFPIRYVS